MSLGSVRQVNINQEMREAYLDYAMSVIVARALPDARDGLKPVHRRILYAMYDMGIRANTPYKKCARIVGEVLGKYHPHGDAAVYETLVRLAQDFSMRYMLVDGQGNFGSIDGDGAAAMRYTEARMANIGETLLTDLEMETVDFVDNFDGTLQEPSVLPAAFPNLIVNGASGIAVGMATNVPPHNLGEVCDACTYMLHHWETMDDISVEDLMQFIKGPDFPTGGLVYRHIDAAEDGEDSLVSAYATGRGKITVRARCHVEEMGRGKSRIIVSELPYQTNKSALIDRIATLVRDGKLEGLADLRDESDRQGLRISIELQRGVEPSAVLANLFKLTPLQETFSIIMLALVNNEPRTLTLKQALKVYLDHRLDIIRRRSEFELKRARARAHILEGLLKALDVLDEVIATIRRSQTADTARNNLMKLLKCTEIQATAILDMQLRRLAALERKKIQDEYDEKVKLIKYLESLLASPQMMREVIASDLLAVKQAYGDPRRTIIADGAATRVTAESLLVPQEVTWVMLNVDGKLGRTYENTPPKVTGETEGPPRFIMQSDTSQVAYLFTPRGTCATIPIQQIPQVRLPADGQDFFSLCSLKSGDAVAAMLCLPASLEEGFLFFATAKGEVKRLRMQDLPGMRSDVFKVMDIDDDDQLLTVFLTQGENEVVLGTTDAQAIRFSETEVRPTGLGAGGMRGIKLSSPEDRVIGASRVHPSDQVWTITSDGVAKSTPVTEYPTQGRAGGGVITMTLPKGSQGLAAITLASADETILLVTTKGKAKALKVGAAPAGKRALKGDFVISMGAKEQILSIARYAALVGSENGHDTKG